MLIPNPGSDLAFRVRKGLLGSHFNATSAETFTGLTGASSVDTEGHWMSVLLGDNQVRLAQD